VMERGGSRPVSRLIGTRYSTSWNQATSVSSISEAPAGSKLCAIIKSAADLVSDSSGSLH